MINSGVFLRPAGRLMSCSWPVSLRMARREPRPASASRFCSFTVTLASASWTNSLRLALGATRLTLHMTVGRSLLVFGIMLAVCAMSGYLALRKLRKLDPAEVFG